MKTAILQVLMIEGMVTIEFKLTGDSGQVTYLQKAVKTKEDFEAFKRDLKNGIDVLEDVIKHELKNKSNDTTGTDRKDVPLARHQPAEVL